MKMKFRTILPLLALILCLGAFLFPVTAFAQTGEDTTPPTLTATLSGDTLTATAKDSGSGVDSIYVGKHRFATLADGTARLRFKDYAGTTDKQVEVYATDVAGNRSQSVMIDNPYYVAPATPTTAPVTSTPTPASTQAPATPTPAPSSTPAPTGNPATTPSASLPEPQPPADSVTEEAIPSGSNPFTPDGGGTVQDNATGEEGKEFFTVTTAAGNVYYLIIDRQRGTENVYFLSPVTEEDLLGMTDGSAVTDPGTSQPEPQTPAPSPSEEPQPQQPTQSGGMNMGTILFILLAVAAVGGAAYYVKIVKPRKQARDEEDFEDDFEDEESTDDEYFFDGEDKPGAQDSEEE